MQRTDILQALGRLAVVGCSMVLKNSCRVPPACASCIPTGSLEWLLFVSLCLLHSVGVSLVLTRIFVKFLDGLHDPARWRWQSYHLCAEPNVVITYHRVITCVQNQLPEDVPFQTHLGREQVVPAGTLSDLLALGSWRP